MKEIEIQARLHELSLLGLWATKSLKGEVDFKLKLAKYIISRCEEITQTKT